MSSYALENILGTLFILVAILYIGLRVGIAIGYLVVDRKSKKAKAQQL